MKIFALCVVKNEGDIIEECLRTASQWADRIFVFDGQSTDGTWEKVVAMQNDKIVPWRQDGKPFQESLRAEPFNDRRSEASEGDWWCRLDADEFYIDNPREFLAQVPRRHHVVWGVPIEYYITREDLDQVNFNAPMAEILPALRYYKAENSEQRFFRHRPGLVWRETDAWPIHLGIPTPKRIRYRHYKYRSPQQIQNRIEAKLRQQQEGFPVRDHCTARQWEEQLAHACELDFDRGDGQYHLRTERLPRNTDTLPRAMVKLIMHGTGLWP